jgi:hypothetical protein
MTATRLIRYGALCAFLALLLAACDGDAAELTTTSSLVSTPTSAGEAPTTSVTPGGEATTTSLIGQAVGDSEIVARESDTAGETLYIVVPPGAYTDVDIENFVLDLIEDDVVAFGAEIFDDAAAVDAYRTPEAERTEEQSDLVDRHHFASLENGTTIQFRGPFESSGSYVIGS